MNRLLVLVAGLGASCVLQAAENTSSSSSSSAVATTLEPGKAYESCMTLAAGDKRHYSWKADGPVSFTLASREADKPLVKRERMRGDGGTFIAKAAQDYCWTWTAGKKPARLEAKIAP